MGYDVARIKKEIAENKRSAVLSRAKLHQMRIKFHTIKRVTSFNSPYISIPLTQFLAMAENILPHDKFVLFKALFRYPIKTNEITETCFDKLSRIFDGRNPRSIINSQIPPNAMIGKNTGKQSWTNPKYGQRKDGNFSNPKSIPF